MTPKETEKAVAPLHALAAMMSRVWPELRHGRQVDADALEAAARGARASIEALDREKPVELARALAARVSRCEDDLRASFCGVSVDPLALRSELSFLIALSEALSHRLREDARDKAA